MNKQDLMNKLKEIISDKTGVVVEEITNDSNLRDDLGVDSLDSIEIVMEAERELEIAIPDEYHDEVNTVDEAVEYIFKIVENNQK